MSVARDGHTALFYPHRSHVSGRRQIRFAQRIEENLLLQVDRLSAELCAASQALVTGSTTTWRPTGSLSLGWLHTSLSLRVSEAVVGSAWTFASHVGEDDLDVKVDFWRCPREPLKEPLVPDFGT